MLNFKLEYKASGTFSPLFALALQKTSVPPVAPGL
jgi:hypothetical protein